MSAGDYQGTYSAEKVIVTLGGIILSGFEDGDFLSAKYVDDRYTVKVGADGEVGRSKTASRLGEVTITLSQTSAANDALSAAFNLDSMGGMDLAIPFGVADLSGRTVVAASKAWIKTAPDVTFGKELGTREWVLQCADLLMTVGGNG